MEAEAEAAPTLIGPPPSNVTRDASGWEGHLLAKSTISTACEGSEESNFVEVLPIYLFLVGSYCLVGVSSHFTACLRDAICHHSPKLHCIKGLFVVEEGFLCAVHVVKQALR